MEEYPNDTVSQILWSRNSKMFATACWDGYVRVYSVNDSGVGFLKLEFKIFLG
jgi:WD40 repeat protein